MTKRRKPRSDSNYAIYAMTDPDGNIYVGLTRKTESTILRSVKRRWAKHISRAKCDNLEWPLYSHINAIGLDVKWKHEVLEVVKGRKEAYAREREIILETNPNLNMQYMREN